MTRESVSRARSGTARTGHDARVRSEFARQAESFAASATLGSAALTQTLVESLGPAATGRVLDLAAGPGLVAAQLAGRAREVVALDLTRETLRVARARLEDAGRANVGLVCGDGTALPFAPGRFDAAVVRLALHHLEAPERALAEAHRALRAGGVLAVLDLLAPEDAEDAALLTALERLRDPSHVRALAQAEMQALLERTGFELLHRSVLQVERRFSEWAAIVADPLRTDALERVMRELARRGVGAGVDLRVQGGDLVFDYRFALLTGRR